MAGPSKQPRNAPDSFFDLLPLVSRELHTRVWPRLQKAGLTNAQFWVLKWLQVKGPFTPSDLAAFLGISGPSVTGMINELEGAGFITRVRSKEDRRVVTLAATAKGERLLAEAAAEVQAVAREASRRIPPADIGAATRVLRAMAAELASPPKTPKKTQRR